MSTTKRYTLAEARKRFAQGNKFLAADVTVSLHLFINNNATDEEGFIPTKPTDLDCAAEVSLPTKAESGNDFHEIAAMLERNTLSSSKGKALSLDEIIRLFKLDPNAPIWECDDVE